MRGRAIGGHLPQGARSRQRGEDFARWFLTTPAGQQFIEESRAAVARVLARVLTCPLCGQFEASHDEAACDAKMQAWRPIGLL